jgi:hypothetical protein
VAEAQLGSHYMLVDGLLSLQLGSSPALTDLESRLRWRSRNTGRSA